MTPIVTYRGTVFPWHCDHMGHMNVMWYTGKFDEATWQAADGREEGTQLPGQRRAAVAGLG